MIYLIYGASHTGKTKLAQTLLEKYRIPYLCLDHLKMGLIRSGNTPLTPEDDDKLTDYLWPIAREIIKTAIENDQNLIMEGCYVPFDWQDDFEVTYQEKIKSICLIMSQRYIDENFDAIKSFANVIEKRLDDSFCDKQLFLKENQNNLNECIKRNLPHFLIDGPYNVEFNW